MTLVIHPDGSTSTIADPSITQGRRIMTRLRLADGSTVPIELVEKPNNQLKVGANKPKPIKRCRNGHVRIEGNIYQYRDGYHRCMTCRKERTAKWKHEHLTEETLKRKLRRAKKGK